MKAFLLAGTALLSLLPAVSMAQTAGQTTTPAAGTPPSGESSSGSQSDEARRRFGQSATEDIIVTAQRREERLQDVPVAISVYGAEKRDELGIETIQDVAKFTPGVSFSEFPNRLFVRGVGRFTNQLGSDPGVATYVDGFYTSETTAIGSSPILVDRVEILRGPQGTLFGRNAIGGAANVISQRPTPELHAEVRMIAGNYETIAGAAAISGPITNWLRFRVTGSAFNQGEGYLDNVAGPNSYYRSRNQLLEGQLEANIGSALTAWVKYQYFNSSAGPVFNTQIDPYATAVSGFFLGSSLIPTPTTGYTVPNPGVTDIFKASLNYSGYENIRNANQVIGHLSYDFGGAVLKYIGGYQTFDFSRSEDYDRTSRLNYQAAPGITIATNLVNNLTDRKRFYSHELNVTSDTPDKPLKYIFGIYYYHERETQTYDLLSPDQPELGFVLAPPNFTGGAVNPDRSFLNLGARQVAKSYAGYGQLDYKIVPTVTLTAGLRYSRDEKDGFESRRYVYFNPFVVRGFGLDVSPALTARNISGHWEALTGKANIAYDPDGNTNFYANYSRGYKAGGFNLYSFVDPVKKETLNAYEVGLKKILPGRLQANLAAFYYDYRNTQVPVSFVQPGSGLVLVNFINAPRTRSYGFEAETVFSPTDTLQLLVSYSYLNAEFRDFSGYIDVTNPAAGAQNLRGNRVPQSPKNKVTASLLNRFDLGGGISIIPVATVNYTSAQYYGPFMTAKYRQGGYTQADFRLNVKTKDGLQVNGFVRNAFNNRSFNGFQLGPEASGFARQVTFNTPRTYGVELIGKF